MTFESTSDSVVIVDRDWRINYLNGPALALIANSRELIGKDMSEVLPESAEIDFLGQLRKAADEQRPASLETRCQSSGIWYAINMFPSSQGLAIFSATLPDTSKLWKHVA
jgi:PAS domain-containing protein